MKKQILHLLLLLCLCLGAFNLSAQCNNPEIPGNGVDEDCDGLDDIYLAMPPYIYAAEGQDLEIYFRNLILSQHPQDYVFEVNTALSGNNTGQKWVFVANNNAAGEYPLTIKVKTNWGQVLKTGSTIVRIAPNENPSDMNAKRLLLMGHSFFDQGYLPKYMWDLLHQPGNPPITFHGKKASWANNDARHEGYGGMMARWFINNPASPIRYGNGINMRQYFNDVCGYNNRPDWLVFHLDINDFCGYSALAGNTLQEIDDSIVGDWNRHATRIIDSIRTAAPNTKIAICMSPPPNARQSSFDITYGGNPVLSNRWRWQKIINRLAVKSIQRYGNRENENIFLIPEYVDLDDFAEYNPPDPRHPDPSDNNINTHCGYNEIAKQIYSWVRWMEHHPNGAQPVLLTFYRDNDGDGFGNAGQTQLAVSAPNGFVTQAGDCDDNNAAKYPGATENCTNGADDDCDNSVDEDPIAPNVLCKNNITLPLDANGMTALTPWQVDNGSTDNCSAISLTLDKTTFTCADLGNKSVKLKAKDVTGNESTCESYVLVVDQMVPVAKCKANVTVPLNNDGNGTIEAPTVDNGSSDNCSNLSITLSKYTFSCGDIGQVLVTMVVTDNAGNQSTCQTNVRVRDNALPKAFCKNSTAINLDANGHATISPWQVDNGSYDNCGGITLSLDAPDFTCEDVGTKQVTLTVSDATGNTKTCQSAITVQDVTAPAPLCKASLVLSLNNQGIAEVNPDEIDNGSWDACGIASRALNMNTFDCDQLGIHLVQLILRDAAGNQNACETPVEVVDNKKPQVSLLNTAITVLLDANGTAVVNLNDHATVTDNCSAQNLQYSRNNVTFAEGSLIQFDCADVSVGSPISVWIRAIDLSGNISLKRELKMQIMDVLAPEVLCKNATVFITQAQTASVSLNDLFVQTSDLCGSSTVLPFDSVFFNCNDAGTVQNFEIQARDVSGNIGTCVATVQVVVEDSDADGINDCDDECPQDATTSVMQAYYLDVDADGYGFGDAVHACTLPLAMSENNSDCDDNNADIYPGATEVFNAEDDDCDGAIDENLVGVGTIFHMQATTIAYPNPVSDWLKVEWNKSLQMIPQEVWVSDLRGVNQKVVFISEYNFGQIQVNMDGLASGTWFLKIKFQNGYQSVNVFQKM